MKNIIFILIFSLNLYACGCVDASAASSGADTINDSYDSDDEGFNVIVKEHIESLKEAALQEIENNKNLFHSDSIRIDTIVELKDLNFKIIQEKSIKAISGVKK